MIELDDMDDYHLFIYELSRAQRVLHYEYKHKEVKEPGCYESIYNWCRRRYERAAWKLGYKGASPQERIIGAARSNNPDLLEEIVNECTSPEAAAALLNSAKSVLGNYAYHEAALRGNWEVIDFLLDQEGFECDPINTREGDTPLHSAVRYINEGGKDNWEYGEALVKMMLEAGSDPRIRNKAHLTPFQLTDPSNTSLRSVFQQAEYAALNHSDFVDHDILGTADKDAVADGYNSASDSE